MDPINSYQLSSQILLQERIKNAELNMISSTISISKYETKNFKNLLPQILAAILVTSYHISIGVSVAFSAILLPQLNDQKEFEVTENEASWMASIIALTTPLGSLIVGFLMDRYGRLRTLAMASIPGVAGCTIVALAQNSLLLIFGRGLVGFSSAIGSNPAIVYLTEIARKDMRGSLISLGPALSSLGMVLTFIMGWFMHWRTVSWWSNIFVIIPCILVLIIPESPSWLVSKNRSKDAAKSLKWINKYQPHIVPELQLALLQKEHERKTNEQKNNTNNSNFTETVKEFLKPTGYKPLIILSLLFLFQQLTGIFVLMFYSITFFQEVGSNIDPYLASILIGVVRFVMSVINTFVLKNFKRRFLLMLSFIAMSICVFFSGFYTLRYQNNASNFNWIPILLLLLYVLTSTIGVIPVPYSMTAELFPLKIRGVAQSMSICMSSFFGFVTLQLHPVFYKAFHGIAGEQLFFGGLSLVGLIYSYIFLPETHEKKLSEIEEYFEHNIIYINQKKSVIENFQISSENEKLNQTEALEAEA